ncbi:hypothetical protein CVT25_011007 [Psilocybe cyanescens]|uniref:Uncharacterized protein n=1 Tax=Psilocybe cyanescens TaxID=93625 RepID=A0A409WFZ9_PSICY|nr:hypothetical protein CVT25_011007 [Psilocybe cyanescens]
MSDSSPPAYTFHGPNTSHSKDNGSGSRTYHVPNYATSYASDKSKLISVKFVEDKELSRAVIVVVSVFLLFAAVPLCMTTLRSSQVVVPLANPSRSSESTVHPVLEWPTSEEPTNKNKKLQAVRTEEEHSDISSSRATSSIPRNGGRSRDIHWDSPQPGARCLGFGTREYTARLKNLPFFSNWEEACKETAIEIHGVLIAQPTRCESKWPMGGVTGHWIVDYQEDRCLARWGKITNKRFSSRLLDVRNGEDGLIICGTAPALIDGAEKPGPTFCESRGLWGIYGVWDVDDQAC